MRTVRLAICAAASLCVALALVGCPDIPSAVDTSVTVTFDSQGGGSVSAEKTLPGNPVSEPVNLTNATDESLIFSGWYTEAACTTRWDFDDNVTESMTLYAKWNAADTLAFTAISEGAAWAVAKGSGTLDADLYIPAYYKGVPVTSVAKSAFSICTSLTSVILSSGLKSIGAGAFGLSHLASIELPSTLETIGSQAFISSYIASVSIPANVTSIGGFAFSNCKRMTAITVDEGNGYYTAVDGVLFNKGLTYLHSYPAGRSGTAYSIPSGVTEIGSGAFLGSSLTSVTIPTGVTVLDSNAFAECAALHTINIPTSVTTMKGLVFAYSFASTTSTIFIPDSVTSIGDQAFSGCSKLSIRCQAASAPSGWINWNPDSLPVTWECSE